MKPRRATKAATTAITAALGMAGVLVGAVACTPLQPSSNGLCTLYPRPAMPTSTGTQTPAGFKVQMAGAKLAAASSAKSLTSAYTQFNGLTCSDYSHAYTMTPPRFFYYDCVGFTGYTVRMSDPTAWNSLATNLHLRTGFVPTPLAFETFMNGLATTPQPGWAAVSNIQAVKAGDIFAWQPANSNGTVNLTGVGHSVIPLTAPRVIPGSNGQRWVVVIMDSTSGGHGPLDTRKPSNPLHQRNAPLTRSNGSVQASGLGIGTIAFDTTTGGQVTGIEWNVGNAPEKIIFGAARPI